MAVIVVKLHVDCLFLSTAKRPRMKCFIDQFGQSIWLWIILTYEVWEDMCMEISADRVVVAVVVAGGEGDD